MTSVLFTILVLAALPGGDLPEEPVGGGEWRLDSREGLLYENVDLDLWLHLGGVMALDYVRYDSKNRRDSHVFFDRAVFRFEGEVADVLQWRFAPDWRSIETSSGFDEAWVRGGVDPRFRVTGGLLEIGIDVETCTPEENLSFTNYAFPIHLAGRSDLGVRVDGEFEEGLFSYAVTASAGEGFDRFGQSVTGRQLAGRVMAYPLRRLAGEGALLPLDGIFIGGGALCSLDVEEELDVSNPADSKIFHTEEFDAEEKRFWALSFGWDGGPWRVYYDLVRGGYEEIETPDAGKQDFRNQISSWQLTAAWRVTGEPFDSRLFRQRDLRAVVLPEHPLGLASSTGNWGALELAVRYANADIDRDFFQTGFTTYNFSSQEFRSACAAVNWYPDGFFRVTAEVIRTLADDDPAEFGGQGRDTTFVFRIQADF